MPLVDLGASIRHEGLDSDQKPASTTFGIDLPADPADYQLMVQFAQALSPKLNTLTSTQWKRTVVQLQVREDPAPAKPTDAKIDVEKRGRFVFKSADPGATMTCLVPCIRDDILHTDQETINPADPDVLAFNTSIITGDGTTAAVDDRDYDLITGSTLPNRTLEAYKEHVGSFGAGRRRRG